MGRGRIQPPKAGDTHRRRKKGRRPAGLAVKARGGYWYIHGTVVAGDRSRRIRKSTGLPAEPEHRAAAEAIAEKTEKGVREELIYGVKPTVAASVACDRYLSRSRTRAISEYDIWIIKKVNARFKTRPLREISDDEWIGFVDQLQARNAPSTRERFLNGLCAFLAWCDHPSRQWRGAPLPPFERDPKARTSRAPARRRVADLTPELIVLLIDHMPRHIVPQLAVEWSTGARVSSVLMGCRLCDLSLAEGREQITFIETKNGQPVTASLHPWTAEKVRVYLAHRGRLDDREGPVFLDHRGRPYGSGKKGSRGRNKTGFRTGRAKAVKALLKAGRREEAQLLGQVTQHWLRHWFATHTLKLTGDVRLVMDQGGWLDVRSVMRYAHDVPSVRRRAINALPIGATLTQDQSEKPKSGTA